MTTIPDFPNPGQVRAEKAREIARQVSTLVEALDGFTVLTAEENIRLAMSASVPDPFLEMTAHAMEQQQKLASAGNTTPAVLRDTIVVSEAYNALADELEMLTRGVRDTTRLLRSEAGTEALRVYAVAQKLTRARDSEKQVRWLDKMRQALNRGRKIPKPVEPDLPDDLEEQGGPPKPKPKPAK